MDRLGEHHDEMWDEEDGFYYDLLRLPTGTRCGSRSGRWWGSCPFAPPPCSRGTFSNGCRNSGDDRALRKRHPEVVAHVAPTDEGFVGVANRRLLSVMNRRKLERVLAVLLDENEFLGPHGIRSLSKCHRDHPFVFHLEGRAYDVTYLPAESNTGMFGGNSNWRGPVWMPVNGLLIRSLLNLYFFYGDEFKVECPTGSGNRMTLFEVAKEIRGDSHRRSCATRTAAGPCTGARRNSRPTRTGGT